MNKLCLVLFFFAFAKMGFGQRSEWNKTHDMYENITDGLYIVIKNELAGFQDENGKMLIAPQYMSAEEFSEGLAQVTDKQGKKKFIDKNNKTILNLTYDDAGAFHAGLLRVTNTKGGLKSGFIDKIGKVIIPLQYENAANFHNGFAQVTKAGSELVGLINHEGKLIVPYKYHSVYALSENRFKIYDADSKCGVIDENGKEILPMEYSYISSGKKDNRLVAEKGYGTKEQLFDNNGKLLFPEIFKNIIIFDNGLVGLKKENGKWSIINEKNEYISNEEYDKIHHILANGYIVVKKNYEHFFINAKNERLDSLIFEDINEFYDGNKAITVKKNGKYGIISRDHFHTLIPFEYDYPFDFRFGNLMKVVKDNKVGYINQQNQTIIPFEYSEFYNSDNNHINPSWINTEENEVFFYKDGKSGLVNWKTGKILIPFEHEVLGKADLHQNRVFMDKEKKGLMNMKNEVIIPAEYDNIHENSYDSRKNSYFLTVQESYRIASVDGKKMSDFYSNFTPTRSGYVVKRNEKYGLIDKYFKEVVPIIYNYGDPFYRKTLDFRLSLPTDLASFSNGYADKIIVNAQGKEVLPSGYSMADEQAGDLIILKSNKGYGAMDTLGNIVIPCIYERFMPYGKGFVAFKNGHFGVIDAKNNIIHPFVYFIARKKEDDGRLRFVRGVPEEHREEYNGAIKYNELKAAEEDKLPYREDILGKDLKFLTNFAYESLSYQSGFYLATKNKLMGILDSNFKQIVPFQYTSITFLSSNFAAEKNGKRGIISIKNEVILPFEYDEFRENKYENKGFIYAIKNNKKGIFFNNKLIIACEYDGFDVYDENKQGWIKTQKGEKWGYVNQQNETMIPCEFSKEIRQHSEKFFRTQEGSLYGLIDLKGKQILPIEYEYISYDATDGGYQLTKKGQKGFLKKDGTLQIEGTAVFEKYNVFDEQSKAMAKGGVLAVRRGEKWGLQQETGRVILAPTYDKLELGDDKTYWIATLNDKQFVLNNEGEIINKSSIKPHINPTIPAYYDFNKDSTLHFYSDYHEYRKLSSSYSPNRIYTLKNLKMGLIDFKGNTIIPPTKFDEIGRFENGIAPAKKNGYFGFIDTTGKTIIEFFLEDAHNFVNGFSIVKKNGKFGAMNTDGKLVIPFKFEVLYDFLETARMTVGKEKESDLFLQFIDNKGVILGKDFEGNNTKYFTYASREREPYSNAPEPRGSSGGTYIYEQSGKQVFSASFNQASNFYEKRAAVAFGNKYGYINEAGEPITAFIYEKAYNFKHGLAIVKRNNKYYYINTEGKCVIGCEE